MNCRCADRNCNHNDSHSEKDLPLYESADDCRPIAGDFHLFSCNPVNTNGITRFCKVCFELHETDFAAQNPCRMLGWSCSKVAIPIADFTLRFFVFHRDLRKGKK